jgi:hypothetical protein
MELEIHGNRFAMSGSPFEMWGIRAASAATTDDACAALIENLDEYHRYGVNAIAVFFQGSSGGYMSAFSEDGGRVETGVQRRMAAILEATRRRGMAIIAGLFYQRQGAWLRNGTAYEASTRTAARFLRPWRHAILNVANEQNSHHWRGCPYPMNDPTAVIRLCEIVAEEDDRRIVGGGGYDHENNVTIARSLEVRALLFDGVDYEDAHALFVKSGIAAKPLVNVELFGSSSAGMMVNAGGRVVQGAWHESGSGRERGRRDFLHAIEFHARHPGLFLFGHFQGWCQGLGHGLQNRFDLGGRGTLADPGIRWYFEAVREARQALPRPDSANGTAPPTKA